MLVGPEGEGDGTATTTPGAQPALGTAPADYQYVVDSGGESITMTVDSPVRVELAGRSYQVQPQVLPPDGVWSPSPAGPGTAVWVYGTVVNYLLGLTDDGDNRTALQQLQPGDEIVMTTQEGRTFTFAVTSRQTLPRDNRDIFAQNAPGVTLVLLGGEEPERMVVQGRYVVTEATAGGQGSGAGDGGNVVELGETAQLDGAQITVTGARYVFDEASAPAGFAYYLVEYQLQNNGATALDTALLRLALADDLGNQYALNTAASQQGNNPMLTGSVNPGETVQATAGYQIPATLNSAVLRWMVSRTDSNAQIQVNIPFRQPDTGGQQAAATLTQAEVSVDGTSLLLTGQITNLSEQPLVVEETDVTLQSGGTVYLIFSVNPGFPWVIGPGQNTPFSVTFQRPAEASAVFRVLSNEFQLDGLR
jgi:hypothetical protein